jgi:hypothetical protein
MDLQLNLIVVSYHEPALWIAVASTSVLGLLLALAWAERLQRCRSCLERWGAGLVAIPMLFLGGVLSSSAAFQLLYSWMSAPYTHACTACVRPALALPGVVAVVMMGLRWGWLLQRGDCAEPSRL